MRSVAGLALALVPIAVFSCSTSDDVGSGPSTPIDSGTSVESPEAAPLLDGGDDGAFTLIEGRGGSRIAARYVQTTDGLRTFAGLVDTKLGGPCDVALLSDGIAHCIPSSAATGSAFADAACTVAVAEVQTACAVPTLIQVNPAPETCDSRTELFLATKNDGTEIFRKTPSGTCVSEARSASFDYYATAGSPRAPSEYVGFMLGARLLGSRISVRMLQGDDGSSIPMLRWGDVQRGKGCTLATASDKKLRCLPASRDIAEAFSDPACKSRISFRGGCDPWTVYDDAVAKETHYTRCGATSSVFARGLEQSPMTYYQRDQAAACRGPYSLIPGVQAPPSYSVGAEIVPTAYPEVGAKAVGGTRLEESVFVAEGSAVRQFLVRDETLGTECRFRNAADGKLRCLPDGVDGSATFADAGCTLPIAYDYDADSCGALKYTVRREATGCSAVFRVFSLSAKTIPTNGTIWTGSPGACTSAPAAAGTYWSVGPEVAPTGFAEGTFVLR